MVSWSDSSETMERENTNIRRQSKNLPRRLTGQAWSMLFVPVSPPQWKSCTHCSPEEFAFTSTGSWVRRSWMKNP